MNKQSLFFNPSVDDLLDVGIQVLNFKKSSKSILFIEAKITRLAVPCDQIVSDYICRSGVSLSEYSWIFTYFCVCFSFVKSFSWKSWKFKDDQAYPQQDLCPRHKWSYQIMPGTKVPNLTLGPLN